jgi:hypothetical protein
MDEQVLGELHRAGVLVPLYRVDLDARAGAKAIDMSAHLTSQQIHVTVINELFGSGHEGRLADPAAVGFEPACAVAIIPAGAWSGRSRRPRPLEFHRWLRTFREGMFGCLAGLTTRCRLRSRSDTSS